MLTYFSASLNFSYYIIIIKIAINPRHTNPSAMIMRDVPDMLASGVVAGIVPGVRNKVCICHLILLLVLHHVFYHCIMATESRRKKVCCDT